MTCDLCGRGRMYKRSSYVWKEFIMVTLHEWWQCAECGYKVSMFK